MLVTANKQIKKFPATYSGTSRSVVFACQRQLQQAAMGSRKMTHFFHPKLKERACAPSPSPVSQEGSTIIDNDDQGSSKYTDGSLTTEAAPAPADEPSDEFRSAPMLELTSEEIDLRDEAWGWINPMNDEEEEPEEQTIYETTKKLIMEAKKFKSFSHLMHLHAIKAVADPTMCASIAVAKSVGKGPYFARKIRLLTCYIGHFCTLPPTMAGKHNAHPSLLNNEWIAQAVRRYLTILADGEITPQTLCKQVNNVIIPTLGLHLAGAKISESCAKRWLHKLGYKMKEVKKGMYVDGHERPNVIEYWMKFLENVRKNASLRQTYTDEALEPIEPTLGPGDRLHVPVYHDESICRSNALWRRVWVRNGRMPLRKKGEGHAIHISDFVVEHTGRIVLNEEQRQINNKLPPHLQLQHMDAQEIIYPGKNNDGWWNMERLIVQVRRMIPIFERLYPGAVGEFFFDQSSAHDTFAPNALNSKEMNLRPGGKQWVMHSTFIPMDNPHLGLRGMPQEMVFPTNLPSNDPNYEHRGKPKGLRQVLEERGLWELLTTANQGKLPPAECKFCNSSRKTQEQLVREAQAVADGQNELEGAYEDVLQPGTSSTCCMQKCLSEQADFKAEKPLLQITIEAAGHWCYFLLKFHCELNPIEMYWGWTKTRLRVASDGTFPTEKRLVPEILDSCPVKTIQAFFRKTWRYTDAYRKGLNAKQAEYAVKKYRSHHSMGPSIMMSLGIMDNPS
ncbi:hypothetical protein K439DRAFT_1652205 [Ramaria rubella]|nr:hypothetical protein K439DRAFT_1652205 [Ramaria rubella]